MSKYNEPKPEEFLEMHNQLIKIDKFRLISVNTIEKNNLNTFIIKFKVNEQDLKTRFNEIEINKFSKLNFCLKYLEATFPLMFNYICLHIKDIKRISLFNMNYFHNFNYEIELIIKEF